MQRANRNVQLALSRSGSRSQRGSPSKQFTRLRGKPLWSSGTGEVTNSRVQSEILPPAPVMQGFAGLGSVHVVVWAASRPPEAKVIATIHDSHGSNRIERTIAAYREETD